MLKKSKKNKSIIKKIAIINPDKCKPGSSAYHHLKRVSKCCPRDCIIVKGKIIKISETACPICYNNVKRTPDGAASVVNSPAENNPNINIVHSYGANSFRLYELPEPHPGSVLGILGANGIGKTTAIKLLSGRVKPNFGLDTEVDWKEIIKYYRGSGLQNYFGKISKKQLKVAVKPQLSRNYTKRFENTTVGQHLKKLNTENKRNNLQKVARQLKLVHLFDHKITTLSGGELQRFAIASTVLKDADVYFFDETTSFLDAKQRIIATNVIRDLLESTSWNNDEMLAKSKYVIVIEHDLTILDFMSDYVQCLYGVPSIYGVVTKKNKIGSGINQFLSGKLKSENMRFRAYELNFKINNSDFSIGDSQTNSEDQDKKVLGTFKYPAMKKTFLDDKGKEIFTLNVEKGEFREKEIICLLGQNGSGKSTFMELLSGKQQSDNSKKLSLVDLGVSYKEQNCNGFFRKYMNKSNASTLTVQKLLEMTINKALCDRMFRLIVLKELDIEKLEELKVSSLSGGEKQRLSIAICLGTTASIYLIDEPSANLDYEQRILTAKVIRKWIVNHLGKTCFLIEHDFLMSTIITDRVILYEGKPGINCTAKSPLTMKDGFNNFLKQLNITFHRNQFNYRPRINLINSARDKEQKKSGNYYMF